MGRNDNIAIFEDTQKLCATNPVLRDMIIKCNSLQEVILQNDPVEKNFCNRGQPATVTVTKRRTLEAAQKYKGKKVCALNFASAKHDTAGSLPQQAQGPNPQPQFFKTLNTAKFL